MTWSPSSTWMARIIAVSSGCTTLTWPSGTTLPSATATMSICDSEAQIDGRRDQRRTAPRR